MAQANQTLGLEQKLFFLITVSIFVSMLGLAGIELISFTLADTGL